MSWFAIRAVYLHDRGLDGTGIYEERIVLFQSTTADEAFELAKSESKKYLQDNPSFRQIGRFEAFMVGDEVTDFNGTEVWSVLSMTQGEPDEFYRRRYTEVEFQAHADLKGTDE